MAWMWSDRPADGKHRDREMRKTLLLSSFAIVLFMPACRRDTTIENKPAEPATAIKTSAKELSISDENANLLQHLQEYPHLEKLSIECLENLKSLPDSIGVLGNLKELRIDNGNWCVMNPTLPESLGKLHSLRKLVLYGAQDARWLKGDAGPQPHERHQFPKSMSQLQNLTDLDLGRNGIDELPAFVKDLPKLRVLGLEWNEFKIVPPIISNLRELRTLKLEANDLNDLPDFLNKLPHLSQISLGYNCKITQNPSKVKSLKRRFPNITFDFTDEYDCPAERPV